jgi:transcriptional regulator with XRE-family HTH domain
MPERLARRFGEHLRALRQSRNLTQEQLAEHSGLSVDTVRRVERGALSPTLETLDKLARGLDLTLSSMFAYFDRGGRDEVSELRDYVASRTSRQARVAMRVLRAMFEPDEESKR